MSTFVSTPRAGRLARRVVALAVLAASALAPATPGAADPVSDAKAKVAAAQKAADEAAANYASGETRMAQLSDEIDRLQEQIARGEEQVAGLRLAARRRAVAAYKDTGSGVEFFTADDNPLDAARRQKLLEEANARDNEAVARLAQVQDDLGRRRKDVDERRAEQAAVLDQLQAEARRLESELTAAQKAQVGIEEEVRRDAAERQARERAAASSRPSSGGGGSTPVGGLICPIRGPVSFVDTWGAPRGGGRTHEGVDLMSPRGTPNVAVVSGTVTMKSGEVSGNGVHLQGDNGDLYYYFHLDAYEGGPRHVSQGEVVGYVGNTGDASGGPTHTHFEIHPGGGGAVNPYPAVRAVC